MDTSNVLLKGIRELYVKQLHVASDIISVSVFEDVGLKIKGIGLLGEEMTLYFPMYKLKRFQRRREVEIKKESHPKGG